MLYGSLLVTAIVLIGDMAAPVGWTPGFRIPAGTLDSNGTEQG